MEIFIIPIIAFSFFIALIILARLTNGFWFWTEIYFRHHGIRTEARLLADAVSKPAMSSGRQSMSWYLMAVEFKDPRDAKILKGKLRIQDLTVSSKYTQGEVLPILMHPNKPSFIIVDLDQISRTGKARRKAKIGEDEKKIDDLLK